MLVRVQLRKGRFVSRKQGKNRHVALALAALLWPGVLATYVVGFWRLAADLGLAGGFGIARGMFSHWQVWLTLAGVLNIAALVLNRYGLRGYLRAPGAFLSWIPGFGPRGESR